jgi:hypothetical protein
LQKKYLSHCQSTKNHVDDEFLRDLVPHVIYGNTLTLFISACANLYSNDGKVSLFPFISLSVSLSFSLSLSLSLFLSLSLSFPNTESEKKRERERERERKREKEREKWTEWKVGSFAFGSVDIQLQLSNY